MSWLLSSSILLYPLDSEIHKFPLPHEAERSRTHHGVMNIVTFFKSSTDLIKIFAVNKQCLIRFPYSAAIFNNGAVLNTIVLPWIFGSGVRKMDRSILVIAYTDQQHPAIKLIQFPNWRPIAENIG